MPTMMKRHWKGEGLCLTPTDPPSRCRASARQALMIAQVTVFVACLALMGSSVLAAQAPLADATGLQPERSDQSVTVVFANRPIVALRARVLGRGPIERARGAERMLDDLV